MIHSVECSPIGKFHMRQDGVQAGIRYGPMRVELVRPINGSTSVLIIADQWAVIHTSSDVGGANQMEINLGSKAISRLCRTTS